jgi:hypothetical protein
MGLYRKEASFSTELADFGREGSAARFFSVGCSSLDVSGRQPKFRSLSKMLRIRQASRDKNFFISEVYKECGGRAKEKSPFNKGGRGDLDGTDGKDRMDRID